MRRIFPAIVLFFTVTGLVTAAATLAHAHGDANGSGGWASMLAQFHPFFVHFPIALIVLAAVAEVLYVVRRQRGLGDAARFMITAAAWISVVAALSGFAAAWGESFGDLLGEFSKHRIAGIATPALAFLSAGMAASARRTGQVWELMLYRVFLTLALISVLFAGLEGAELVHSTNHF
jgi:uncharacterized membrane protein